MTKKWNSRLLYFNLLVTTGIFIHTACGQTLTTKQLTAEFDRLLSEQFKPGETGCAALVAQKGQIIEGPKIK